jgi:hypothetical protein
MVYELLSRCFILLEDPSLGFLELFQAIVIVARDYIFKLVALVLGVNKLLAMAKDIGGLRSIIVSEVFFWIINYSIILQLQGPLQEHLSPHQFGVSTHGGCEINFFGIKTLFNLHPN